MFPGCRIFRAFERLWNQLPVETDLGVALLATRVSKMCDAHPRDADDGKLPKNTDRADCWLPFARQLFWARNVYANHSLHFVNIVPWHRKYPAKQNPTTRMRYAWVTRPKRPKGAKDQVRQAQSPKSIISRSPETSRIQKYWLCLMLYSHSWNVFVLINHLQFG